MKILFWILAILSIPVSCFLSFASLLAHGLDLYGTGLGLVICLAGMLSLPVCLACAVLGIIKLRKGNAKKALAFVLAALIFCAVVFIGFFADEALYGLKLDASIADRQDEMYGENWNTAPAIDGIPELYQEVLNMFHVAVRDSWPADQLMDLGAVSMADYYGEASTENIGFALMDLNGDGIDELIIAAMTAEEGEGSVVFCIYTDPETPFYAINSVEGSKYYLHPGAAEGTYIAEIVGADAAWEILPAEAENTFDFNYLEGTMDPAGRMTLELIPFSQYK